MKKKLIGILFLIIISLVITNSFVYAIEIPKNLEKIEFINYANSMQINDRTAQSTKDRCYRLVNTKWGELPVELTLDLSAIKPADLELVENAISSAANNWNNSTSKELFDSRILTANNTIYGKNDGINSISFGPLKNRKEIARTTFWYSRKTKEIFDADIKFNTYYLWGDSSQNKSIMDIQNIATHEMGHVLGLKDIYLRSCQNVTMFGYSIQGEIKKQSLESSDITAIKRLYV